MPDLILPDGQRAEFAYEDVDQAIAAGAVPAERDLSAVEQVGAAAAGALRNIPGAGYALNAAAAAGLPGQESIPEEDARAGFRGLAADAPVATAGGEMAGLVGGMVATGGLSGLGEGAAAGATRALGGGIGARIAGKVAGGALTAGLENAAVGVSHQLSEASLGDHEINGEHFAAEIGSDALLGVGLGGALGAIGGGISEALGAARKGAGKLAGITNFTPEARAAEEVASPYRTAGKRSAAEAAESAANDFTPGEVERIAEKQFGKAAPGIGERVQQWYVKQASALSGKGDDVLDKFTALTPEGKAARKLTYDDGAIMERSARDMRTHLDDVLKSSEAVEQEFRGGMKRDFVARSISGDAAEHAALAEARGDQLLNQVQSMMDSDKPFTSQHLRTLENISSEVYAMKAELARGGADAGANAFIALDNIKRVLQDDWKTFGRQLQAGAVAGQEGRAARDAVEFYRASAETLRSDLQNVEVWGEKLAGTQEALNAPWAQSIQSGKDLLGHVTEFHGTNPVTLQKNRIASPGKLHGYLKGLTNPDKDLIHQDMAAWLDGKEKFAKVAKEALDLDVAKAAQADKVAEATARMRATLKQAGEDVTTINQWKQLTAQGGDGIVPLMGAIAGGPVGAMLGGGVASLASPARTIKQLAAIERANEKYGAKLTKGARDFFDARPAVAARAPAMPQAEVAKVAKNAARMSPVTIAARIERAIPADMSAAAPGHAAVVAATLTRAAQHLAQHAPRVAAPVGMLIGKQPEPEPSPQELVRFARRLEVVKDPTTVLDRMKSGDLSLDHVDTLRSVYPKMYESVRSALVEEAAARKTPLTIQEQAALSVLFDEPLHAMFLPSNIAAFQASAQRAEPEQAPGPVARSRKVEVNASRLSTATDKEPGE